MSTTDFDLKTADGMRQFLSRSLYPHITEPPKLLSGGSSKYIFRVMTGSESPSKSVVAIHASPFSAGYPDFPLPQARLRTEYALSRYFNLPSIESGLRQAQTDQLVLIATVPTAYKYFEDDAVMIVEDAEDSITLKSALIDHSMSDDTAKAVGFALGRFAAELHLLGRLTDNPATAKLIADLGENLEAKKISFTVFYDWLEKAASEIQTGTLTTEEMKELVQKVKKLMREEMFEKRDSWTVVHGDFWTGNMLIPRTLVSPEESANRSETVAKKIHVVDWELCKFAPPHFDLGQMVAEMYLPYHFYGNQASLSMIDAFFSSYEPSLNEKTEEEVVDIAFKAMMHFGGHLVVWPRLTGWPTEGGKVDSVIEFGAECIRKGLERDVEFLRNGIFKGLKHL